LKLIGWRLQSPQQKRMHVRIKSKFPLVSPRTNGCSFFIVLNLAPTFLQQRTIVITISINENMARNMGAIYVVATSYQEDHIEQSSPTTRMCPTSVSNEDIRS
jgi:hypothetical protein